MPAQIRDGTFTQFRRADIVVADFVDDIILGPSHHRQCRRVRCGDEVGFGINDDDTGLYRIKYGF